MLEPRPRTAVDGVTWWVPYNTETGKYTTLTCFGKYKTKKACWYAIQKATEELMSELDIGEHSM